MLDRIISGGTPAKLPAHRPSRRNEIVDAAIRVFSRNGYVETIIQDVADEAGVVPTAVYYHFAGKDELFNVALHTVIVEMDEAMERTRPEGEQSGALSLIVAAAWDWIGQHPDHARILYTHLPGTTQQAQVIRREFEEQHIQRAYAYARQTPPEERRHRTAAAAHAASRLSVRTLISMLIAIHPMRLDGGPLSRRSPKALRAAVQVVSERIVSLD